jgi:hypothetical protein
VSFEHRLKELLLATKKYKWKKILDEWGASGLSVTAFCKSKEISTSYFYYHRSKRTPKSQEIKAQQPNVAASENATRFVELAPVSLPAISLPKIKITTPSGYTLEVFL